MSNQTELEIKGPGVEKMNITEIDEAAAFYVTLRDQRVKVLAQEVEAKEKVVSLLHAHEEKLGRAPDGAIRYEYDGKVVELIQTKEKLRVKDVDDDREEE